MASVGVSVSAPTGPAGRSTGAAITRLRPLGVGEMLDAAAKVYRSRPKQMIVASVVVVFPAAVLLTLVGLSAGDPQELMKTDAATGVPTVDLRDTLVYMGGLLVQLVVLVLANNLALAATTRMSMSAYLDEEVSWRESLRFAFRRFIPLTALLVLTFLGFVGGIALCIVPGVWLQGIWAVAVPALLVEDIGAVASLGRSRRLVEGRFWPVLGTIVVGSLLASVVQSVFIVPVLVTQVVGVSFVVTSLLNGVAQFIAVSVTVPFVAALSAVIYVDLRVRKEGFDLELLARGVGVEPGPMVLGSGPLATVVGSRPDEGNWQPWVVSATAGPIPPPGGWAAPAAPQAPSAAEPGGAPGPGG